MTQLFFHLPQITLHPMGASLPDPGRAMAGRIAFARMSQGEKDELDATIARAREGDPRATAELLQRYQGLVYATHARILGPTSDGQDLVQETFTRAIVSLRKLKEVRGFSNWLQKIAASVALDHLRKRQRTRWLSVVAPEFLPEVPAETPGEASLQRTRRIYALLERLPADERAAFSLRWLAEYELTDVAQLCDCSLATVKRRIKRGQDRFFAMARQDPVLADRMDAQAMEAAQ